MPNEHVHHWATSYSPQHRSWRNRTERPTEHLTFAEERNRMARIELAVRSRRNRCFIRQTEAADPHRYPSVMYDSNLLSRDDERLLPLVMAMADGTGVDWSAAAFDPASADQAVVAPSLEQLHSLERLLRAHDAVRSLPPRQRASPTHETLLTEARRKGGQSEHPLRVEWGPLIVHEKIGRGSFGDVYRAWDPRLDREVAL